MLTGHNHTLLQDNFLFATANCHSKENRNGSVMSGCCGPTTACGVSSFECLVVRGGLALSIIAEHGSALLKLKVGIDRNKVMAATPNSACIPHSVCSYRILISGKILFQGQGADSKLSA